MCLSFDSRSVGRTTVFNRLQCILSLWKLVRYLMQLSPLTSSLGEPRSCHAAVICMLACSFSLPLLSSYRVSLDTNDTSLSEEHTVCIRDERHLWNKVLFVFPSPSLHSLPHNILIITMFSLLPRYFVFSFNHSW